MKLNRETQAKGESWEGFEEGWLFFVVLKIKDVLVEVLMLDARATSTFGGEKVCAREPQPHFCLRRSHVQCCNAKRLQTDG